MHFSQLPASSDCLADSRLSQMQHVRELSLTDPELISCKVTQNTSGMYAFAILSRVHYFFGAHVHYFGHTL
jgi:hypothetical protein